jgi:hypothetical protein
MTGKGTGAHHKKEPEWRATFLAALCQSGNVSHACRMSGIRRRLPYKHRDRFPGFRERWDEAIEVAVDSLEAEARRRAVQGIEKPVYHKGAVVGTIREYSDRLLIFLLKANRPEKFRDNYDLERMIAKYARRRDSSAKQPNQLR